jgi:hypothetical protein
LRRRNRDAALAIRKTVEFRRVGRGLGGRTQVSAIAQRDGSLNRRRVGAGLQRTARGVVKTYVNYKGSETHEDSHRQTSENQNLPGLESLKRGHETSLEASVLLIYIPPARTD